MANVLIVDDSTTIRKMIRVALRPLNPTFGEASSGLEAIEQLTMQRFDVVTLDLNMPDMHGLEFLQFVRSHSSLKHIPVLVLTTWSDKEIKEQVLSAGANDFLCKPFKPDELLEAMKPLLEKSDQVEGT
jgi:two-component system chemotaxis response regulator CheY